MIKELRPMHCADPACQERSDKDHLRFVIEYKNDGELKFDFNIELNGVKTWTVPDAPSMNPMDHRQAEEDKAKGKRMLESSPEDADTVVKAWDKGNYIPIDDNGNMLDEFQAIQCLKKGILKFFLQGSKLVGEFVLMKKGKQWLLMKRHDVFASYNSQMSFVE